MFFSLSLAMGITVTYGSYLSKKESLVRNSMVIIVSDTIEIGRASCRERV